MGSILTFGVNAGTAVIMLTGAVLIYLLVPEAAGGPAAAAPRGPARGPVLPGAGKKGWRARLAWLRYLILPLILAAAAGLYGTSLYGVSLGGIVHTVLGAVVGWLGGIVPAVATVLLIAAGVVAVAVLVHDAIKPAITNRAIVAACAVPVTVGAIPGAFGTAAVATSGWVCTGLLDLVHVLIGI